MTARLAEYTRPWKVFTLYGICGVIWLYRGSLRQLCSEIGARFRLLRSDAQK